MNDIPEAIAAVIRMRTEEQQRADEEARQKAQAEMEAQIARNADARMDADSQRSEVDALEAKLKKAKQAW